jgi:MFS family permease
LLAQLPRLADGEVRTFRAFKEHLKPVLELTKGTNDFERITSASITADSPSTGGSSTIFGGIVVIGGLIATAFGAWAGDRLRPKLRGAYFWVIALGAIAAFPLFVLFLYLPLPIGWVVLFFCVCGLFLHVGPGNTIIANVVTTEMRATAFAINILVIHALGDVISPSIMGALADTWDWQVSFLVTSVMIAVAGGIWLLGVRSLEDDTRRAEDADATPA